MMRTNELRIGNIVNDGSKNVVVTGLQLGDDSMLIRTRSAEGETIENMVSAVEVTDHWLERFGFLPVGKTDNGLIFSHTTGLSIRKEGGQYFFRLMQAELVIPLNGIHHLQNLFYDFTGEEMKMSGV